MKAIIYAGIGLFSVATVYGVADYYTTQKKGTLDKLYKEPEEVVVTETPVLTSKTLPANITETNVVNTKAVTNVARKSKRRKRTIRLDDFSRGRIEEPIMVEPVKWIGPVQGEAKKKETSVTDAKMEKVTPSTVIKKELPRRLSLDQFSRAPLRVPVRKEVVVKKN